MKTLRMFALFIVAKVIFTVVGTISFFVNIIRKPIMGESLAEYFRVLAVAEDQLGGSYMYGTEDYTVSSWTYKLHAKGNNVWATWFMKFIDFFAWVLAGQKEHCKKSYKHEAVELLEGGK